MKTIYALVLTEAELAFLELLVARNESPLAQTIRAKVQGIQESEKATAKRVHP